MTSKAQANRKHRYIGLHQNEKQLCLKAHCQESEKIPTKLEKSFTDIMYLKRDVHSEYINNSCNSIIKNKVTQLRVGQRI